MVFSVDRPDGVEEPAGQVQILQEVKTCDLATDLCGRPSSHTPPSGIALPTQACDPWGSMPL